MAATVKKIGGIALPESGGGAVTMFSKFGGNGINGSVTVSEATNFSTIDGATVGVAQYTNLTINAGQTLTIDTKYAYIGVSGDCYIHGTITAVGAMANGGAGVSAPGRDSFLATNQLICFMGGHAGGAGGGGGASTGGVGGGATSKGGELGSAGIALPTVLITISDAIAGSIIKCVGGGGGGDNQYGNGGGSGGGIIYIEVAGALVFDGVLTANGANGATGPKGGGGGGGGMILIKANTITTNTGTLTVTGGTGGGGTPVGGAGATGYSKIILI